MVVTDDTGNVDSAPDATDSNHGELTQRVTNFHDLPWNT